MYAGADGGGGEEIVDRLTRSCRVERRVVVLLMAVNDSENGEDPRLTASM